MSKLFFSLFLTSAAVAGCAPLATDSEAGAWPVEARADYAVFAQRCSKCHSLARPLQSGIDNDEYWRRYVERMRRQPGSGISVADTVPILRFLHVYSLAVRRRKGEPEAEGVSPAAAVSSVAELSSAAATSTLPRRSAASSSAASTGAGGSP